jgi:ubiquinone/menaquinone biosynthesis C-methylase UbiE
MARTYDAIVVPRYEPMARRTIEQARLRRGDQVLDLGCGTGLATFIAAQSVGSDGSVIGIDFSEGQLAQARARREAFGATNVSFDQCDATELEFASPFDAVISNLGVPGKVQITLARAYRALRPGGRISICERAPGEQSPVGLLRQVMASYMKENPAPELQRLRSIVSERRKVFDRLGTERGMNASLEGAGFGAVHAEIQTYQIRFATWREAFDFAAAGPYWDSELRALVPEERAAVVRDFAAAVGTGVHEAAWRVTHGWAQR